MADERIKKILYAYVCICVYNIHIHIYIYIWGFPGGSDGKESACKAGDLGLIPGWEISPGEGNDNTLQWHIYIIHNIYVTQYM